MLLACNPPKAGIIKIILASKHKAAKWLRHGDETWYWPAEEATHASVAALVGFSEYDKGIAVNRE